MKVKICGLTNKEDALWSANFGADYLGFNFWKESPRYISVGTVNKWIHELPPFAQKVGIFVDEESKNILKVVQVLKLQGIQLHGSESANFVEELKKMFLDNNLKTFIIKAFRVKDESIFSLLGEYSNSVDFFLLDTFDANQMGGTGKVFDWNLALQVKDLGKPFFLAGGLTPDNVKEVKKKIDPYAADVSSGVEAKLRHKDIDKVKEFIRNAK
ncbi:MAG: phosphoribosylanthranilate isomerase [Elusimicrobiota bacterium]